MFIVAVAFIVSFNSYFMELLPLSKNSNSITVSLIFTLSNITIQLRFFWDWLILAQICISEVLYYKVILKEMLFNSSRKYTIVNSCCIPVHIIIIVLFHCSSYNYVVLFLYTTQSTYINLH